MTSSPCKLCGRAVVWADLPGGGVVPLDPRPSVYRVRDTRTGSPSAELLRGTASTLFTPDETAFMVSHWATCPEAARVRRGAPPSVAATDCERCGWPIGGECALCAGNVRTLCCGDALRVISAGQYTCARCGVAIGRAWRMRESAEDRLVPVFAA